MALLYNSSSSADLEQTLLHEEALVLISLSQSGIGLEGRITLQATVPLVFDLAQPPQRL
jgi:hypothetical protein